MAPLPPVRKRTNYADIKPDDLIMALFTDRIIGTGALDPEKAKETPEIKSQQTLPLELDLLNLEATP